MSKRLQLQEYLDEQLQRVDGEEGKELLPFSRIEEKLSTIEKKLVLLKDQNLVGSRASKLQSEGKQRGERKEFECQYDVGKSKVMEAVSKREMEVQMTPQKQLKLISKTMSQGLFQLKSGSKFKSKSKQYQTATRTNKEKEVKRSKSPQTQLHLTTVKKGKTKIGSSCKKLSYNSASKINKTHDQHLAELKKDIDVCIKSNQQLKLKISNLQVYKKQYCKLKETIEKLFVSNAKARRL